MSLKQTNSNKPTKACKRALMAALVLSSIPMSFVGCKSTPTGRCGLPDLCEPIVVRDPFPYDVGVPCKGVDAENAGYYRPRWRVLNGPTAECCAAGQCAPQAQLGETVQKPAVGLTQQVSPIQQFDQAGAAKPQSSTPQQSFQETLNRVSAIPVSMATVVDGANTAINSNASTEQAFAGTFSTEIDPIVLPAPLPPSVPSAENSQKATPTLLPPPLSPLAGVELAPVLTR